MSSIPTLPGIQSEIIATERLKMHVLSSGPSSGIPVVFVHGNVSSATFWEETMLTLPQGYRAIAPDLRGYGDTEAAPIDATQGLDDMAADIHGLLEQIGMVRYHMVGHSMGGNVLMKYAIHYPAEILSLTLVATGSPYGYGGTKGVDGQPVYDDGAPAGGGTGNPDFIKLLQEKFRGDDNPLAPINVMRQFYFKPPFIAQREQALLSSMLAIQIGEDHYPGDFVPSENWFGVAPGSKGVLNALSGKHYDASGIVDISLKPPILWVRGDADQIVGNLAMFEGAALGSIGAIPGWPGEEECPPQPMIDQIRAVLDQYQANGGRYEEVVITDAGHTPYIEKPIEFNLAFHKHIQ
ncbi:MAG: alpha/beta hydrolase [Ardenticatenaceae bacterium]|nr:alpha/beta hydrolase [Ardenticatenaceae bacterium]